MEPKVFIILVNYNNVSDTFACLESIQRNNYRNYEVVIIDNKSTDRSCEQLRIKKYGLHYVLIVAEENDGFSAGNNIGIRYAIEHGADYVLLLNNDTLVDPDFLTELIGYQSNHEECAVAVGKIYYAFERNTLWYAGGSVSPVTTRTTHYEYGKQDAHEINNPIQVSFATGCYMSIRRAVIEDVGLLDEDYFLYDEDTDYSLRLAAKKKKIFYVPSSVIYHKVSASTGGGSDLSQYYQVRNHFLLIKKNLKMPNSIIAIGYTVLFLVKRMLKGELKPRNVVNGTIRYLQGETKKRKLGRK
ncbi:MAG: glycosyltransferase family 2 protein [Lachnospiraceae bacterium]|nr:glycosyltransferase family 2 protein [Lachnospiraceae bacterium]